jgi:hypothetical protein
MNPLVELKDQLSRRDAGPLLASVEHMVEAAKIVRGIDRFSTPYQRWRLADRLGRATLQALVEDRQTGLTNRALAEKYHISLSSVKHVLRRFDGAT